MKLSRALVTLLLAALVGLIAVGTAEAASKKLSSGRTFQVGSPALDGKGSNIPWAIYILRLWKSGYRYYYD